MRRRERVFRPADRPADLEQEQHLFRFSENGPARDVLFQTDAKSLVREQRADLQVLREWNNPVLKPLRVQVLNGCQKSARPATNLPRITRTRVPITERSAGLLEGYLQRI